MAVDIQNINKSINDEKKLNRSYLTKGFEQFRNELLNYAKNYFPDKINDFSEASVGGMLLDFAAIVGDSLSFYMDHQYNELNYDTAVENDNIIRHMKNAGIKSTPASPAVVKILFKVRVDYIDGQIDTTQLPKILKNLKISSINNIPFYLLEDVDFNKDYIIDRVNETQGFIVLKKYGLALSGSKITERFSFDNTYIQFPRIFLSNKNVTMIETVIDSNDNKYYEVEFLSQDTVYKSTHLEKNNNKYYEVIPAPYRFIKEDNFETGDVSLRFGSGDANSIMMKSLIQDPTKSALSLYGRDYFPKFSFDPSDLLKTNSLGIAPRNTTIYVTYIYGGGIDHNIPAYNINRIDDTSNILFAQGLDEITRENVINSIFVTNDEPAIGGRNTLTFDELKSQIQNTIKMQNRIVNYQDLLAKIHSMPVAFGKVSKIALHDDNNNIYSKNIHILCKDNNLKLALASDSLKLNLMNYLNEYRLIGDSFNILDAKIFNIRINVDVRINAQLNISPAQVERNIKNNISYYLNDFEINQPISLDNVFNIILNTYGVANIVTDKRNLIVQKTDIDYDQSTGTTYKYSNEIIKIQDQIYKDSLYPIEGGIFEIKYPEIDIIARVVI